MRAVLAETDALAAEVAEIPVPPKQSIRHRHTTAGRFTITSVTKVYTPYLLPRVYHKSPICSPYTSRRLVFGSTVCIAGQHSASQRAALLHKIVNLSSLYMGADGLRKGSGCLRRGILSKPRHKKGKPSGEESWPEGWQENSGLCRVVASIPLNRRSL